MCVFVYEYVCLCLDSHMKVSSLVQFVVVVVCVCVLGISHDD